MVQWSMNVTNYTGMNATKIAENLSIDSYSQSCFQYIKYSCPCDVYRIAAFIFFIIAIVMIVANYKEEIKRFLELED